MGCEEARVRSKDSGSREGKRRRKTVGGNRRKLRRYKSDDETMNGSERWRENVQSVGVGRKVFYCSDHFGGDGGDLHSL